MSKETEKKSLSELVSSLPDYIINEKIIKSDIYPIDKILGGGLELGSFVQFIAESGVGKTTIAVDLSHALCRMDYHVLYIDAEKSVSREILDTTNVSSFINKNFFLIKESEFSTVEEILDQFIATDEINFVIIDSLAALINSCFTNIDNKKGKKSIMTNNTSYNSVPLTKFMDKYKSIAGSKKICFILINQYRNKINMTSGATDKVYGSKNTIYNCDVLIRIVNASSYKEKEFYDLTKDIENGKALAFEIIKSNKLAPGISVPAYLKYGKGLMVGWNYIYQLLQLDAIKKNGSYYSLIYDGDEIKAQGIKGFINELEKNNIMNIDILQELVDEYKSYDVYLDGDDNVF